MYGSTTHENRSRNHYLRNCHARIGKMANMQIAREVFKLLLVERYNSDLAERVKKIDAAFDRGEIT